MPPGRRVHAGRVQHNTVNLPVAIGQGAAVHAVLYIGRANPAGACRDVPPEDALPVGHVRNDAAGLHIEAGDAGKHAVVPLRQKRFAPRRLSERRCGPFCAVRRPPPPPRRSGGSSGPQRESLSVSGSLEEQVARLEAENAVLRERVALLVERIAVLERRLGLNSRNSGKPPSSEGLATPAVVRRTRSLREKTGRKPGGRRAARGRRCGAPGLCGRSCPGVLPGVWGVLVGCGAGGRPQARRCWRHVG